MKAKKPAKYFTAYLAMLALIKVIRIIPRRVGMAITKSLASLYFSLSKKNRDHMIRHLTLAFGEEKSDREIIEIAKRVFLHFATILVDVIRIPKFMAKGINQHIKAENLDILEKAQRDGKGVIILTGHFGNWELMGAWIARNNHDIRVVGAPIVNPWLDKLVVNMRNQAGYRHITRGQGTREILRALKRGALLGMLIDQDISAVNGVFVDFFGEKAHTPTGPLILATRYDVPIIPMFMHLEKDLTYCVKCYEPIELVDTGNPESDIVTNTQKCSNIYEAVIREHPEQWAWFHQRWKTKPVENNIQN